MSAYLYIENPALTKLSLNRANSRKFHLHSLSDISIKKCPSNTLHILLVNNVLSVTNRKKCLDKIKELVDTCTNTHLLLVSYGENVKQLCPIVPLSSNIIEPLSEIINVDYDYTMQFNEKSVKLAIASMTTIDQMNFAFLSNYQNVFSIHLS